MRILFFEPNLCIKTYKFSKAFHQLNHHIEAAYTGRKFDLNYELDDSHITKYHKITTPKTLINFMIKFDLLICKDINRYVKEVLDAKLKLILLIGDVHSGRTKTKAIIPLELEIFQKLQPQNIIFSGTFIRKHAAELFKLPKLLTSTVITNVPTTEPLQHLPKFSQKDGKIHLVYCGSLQKTPTHRNFQTLFTKILKFNEIVLHVIPTKFKEGVDHLNLTKYSNFCLHPTVNYSELYTYLTQFDIGLCLFDMSYDDCEYIHISEPNKFYDYLYSGLPQITNNSVSHSYLIQKHHAGMPLSKITDDFPQQLRTLKQRPIKFDMSKHSLEAQIKNKFPVSLTKS